MRAASWRNIARITAVLSWILTAGASASPHAVGLVDLEGVKAGEVAVLATLDLSSDSKKLSIERGGELSVIELPSGRVVARLGEGLLPKWSPDGSALAFLSRRSGVLALWCWRDGALRQLSRLPDGIDPDIETRFMGYISDAFHYSWSPDGKHLAFASRVPSRSLSKSDAGAPLVLDASTPPSLTLFDVFAHPGGGTGGVIEARNGRDLTFRAPRSGEVLFNQLFVVDVASGKAAQVTQERATSFDPAWSPDSRMIAFARVDADQGGGPSDIIAATAGEIMVLDPATKKARILAQGTGVKYRPLWSPDGTQISFLESKSFESDASIRVLRVEEGEAPQTFTLNGPVVQYDWDHGFHGNHFLVSFVGGATSLSSEVREHVRDLSSFGSDASREWGPWSQDRMGAVVAIDGETNASVWSLATGKAPAKKLLSLSSTEGLALARSERISWRNARNEALQGEMLYPLNYMRGRRYPLIVDVYPFPPPIGWMNPMGGNQGWASAGYMVFRPGPRAPHAAPNCSVSPKFCDEGRGPSGWDVTVDDVMSGIAALDRRGLIDSKRMCLYGHSNGGGVVDYLVTRTDAFRCAVSVAPVLPNWLGTSLLWYDGLGLMSHLAGAKLWDDPSAYVKLSAVFRADKVKTPMLLADGDEDGSFLLGTIEMYNALRAAGAPVTLLRYPNQGHAFTGDALHDFWHREMQFFAAHLKPASVH